jgi:hypothetical protein
MEAIPDSCIRQQRQHIGVVFGERAFRGILHVEHPDNASGVDDWNGELRLRALASGVANRILEPAAEFCSHVVRTQRLLLLHHDPAEGAFDHHVNSFGSRLRAGLDHQRFHLRVEQEKLDHRPLGKETGELLQRLPDGVTVGCGVNHLSEVERQRERLAEAGTVHRRSSLQRELLDDLDVDVPERAPLWPFHV